MYDDRLIPSMLGIGIAGIVLVIAVGFLDNIVITDTTIAANNTIFYENYANAVIKLCQQQNDIDMLELKLRNVHTIYQEPQATELEKEYLKELERLKNECEGD